MGDHDQVRQDGAREHKPEQLSPEDEAARIERLKASHHSHHVAGGCAEQRETATNTQE